MKKTIVAAAVLTLAVANVPAVNAQPVAPMPAPAPGMVNMFGMWVPAEALAAGAALAGLGVGALVALFASGGAGSSGGTGSGGEAASDPVVVTPTTTAPAVTVTPTTTAPPVTAPPVTVTPTSTIVQTATSTVSTTVTRTLTATTVPTSNPDPVRPGDSPDFFLAPDLIGNGAPGTGIGSGDIVISAGEDVTYSYFVNADSTGQGLGEIEFIFVADPSQVVSDIIAPITGCTEVSRSLSPKRASLKLQCSASENFFVKVNARSNAANGTLVGSQLYIRGNDRAGNPLSAQTFGDKIDGINIDRVTRTQLPAPIMHNFQYVVGHRYP